MAARALINPRSAFLFPAGRGHGNTHYTWAGAQAAVGVQLPRDQKMLRISIDCEWKRFAQDQAAPQSPQLRGRDYHELSDLGDGRAGMDAACRAASWLEQKIAPPVIPSHSLTRHDGNAPQPTSDKVRLKLRHSGRVVNDDRSLSCVGAECEKFSLPVRRSWRSTS